MVERIGARPHGRSGAFLPGSGLSPGGSVGFARRWARCFDTARLGRCFVDLMISTRSEARKPSHSFKHKPWRSLMSKEFEKLEALLYLSKPSERDPQVDLSEAAKLAARWGWLVHQAREKRVELPQMRRPDRGALGTP
jgi:hypothetical protein